VGDEQLPIVVRTLLTDCIDSVEQLEILVLLYRVRERWTMRRVSEELRTNPDSTRERLEELVTRGLATARDVDGERRYELVADPVRERAVGSVASAYEERRVSVITFVVTKPAERIRSFADAFRIRRSPNG
jgi:DNA-binding IclR family transcriptional regulator